MSSVLKGIRFATQKPPGLGIHPVLTNHGGFCDPARLPKMDAKGQVCTFVPLCSVTAL